VIFVLTPYREAYDRWLQRTARTDRDAYWIGPGPRAEAALRGYRPDKIIYLNGAEELHPEVLNLVGHFHREYATEVIRQADSLYRDERAMNDLGVWHEGVISDYFPTGEHVSVASGMEGRYFTRPVAQQRLEPMEMVEDMRGMPSEVLFRNMQFENATFVHPQSGRHAVIFNEVIGGQEVLHAIREQIMSAVDELYHRMMYDVEVAAMREGVQYSLSYQMRAAQMRAAQSGWTQVRFDEFAERTWDSSGWELPRVREAEEKAKELLGSLIGKENLKSYEETGNLYVEGKTGKYIIRRGQTVLRVNGEQLTELCVHIQGKFQCPPTDHVIALMLELQTDEDEVIRTANNVGSRDLSIEYLRAACLTPSEAEGIIKAQRAKSWERYAQGIAAVRF